MLSQTRDRVNAKRQGFSRGERLLLPREFERVYQAGRRAGDRYLLVYGLPNKLERTRIGLSVSKRLGNAVRRARLKRLLREAFRLVKEELPRGYDLVLIPRQVSRVELADFQASLKRLAAKLS